MKCNRCSQRASRTTEFGPLCDYHDKMTKLTLEEHFELVLMYSSVHEELAFKRVAELYVDRVLQKEGRVISLHVAMQELLRQESSK